MKVQEVILKAMAGSLKWWERPRSSRFPTTPCGAGGSVTGGTAKMSYRWVNLALQEARLVKKRSRRGTHRRRGPRRPLDGPTGEI